MENLVLIFVFIFATYGLTSIVVDGSIFYSFREWIAKTSDTLGMLFSCYRCFGFWAGMVICYFVQLVHTDWVVSTYLIHGFIGSGVCWQLAMLASYLEPTDDVLND